MKKQYIFVIMIVIILYISYLIIRFSYKEYKINSDIEYIKELIINLEKDIKYEKTTINYKASKAYRNKVLKEQQSFKNKGEKVVYFTSEEKYNKYTKPIEDIEVDNKIEQEKIDIKEMSIYEKWMYFLFENKKNI